VAVGALVALGIVGALVVLGNLPGLLIAMLVIGVLLVVVGVLALPFVLAGVAVYGLTRLAAGATSPGRARRPWGPPSGDRAAAPAPGHPAARPGPRDLTPDLAAQVARIQEKGAALQSPDQQPYVSVADRHRVEETLGEYLPRILATYRAFPQGSDSWTIESEGATVHELVARQLAVLEESLDEIAQRVFRAGADHLLAQQRFLEERFPPSAGELHL
jgi:hypothetical protein